jgi:hypothetical protein
MLNKAKGTAMPGFYVVPNETARMTNECYQVCVPLIVGVPL